KTAETKKQMTETEYSQNREAIRGISVVEAYAVANSENAEASSRALEGDFKLTFKDEEISSSVIISKLKEKAKGTENEAEKAFYDTLSSTIPPNFTLKIKNGSFVNFKVNNDGFKVVSSLNVTIFIGDKTIEIEKDADEKWIEIDGTFFDDSELENMLDRAEDAAEAIKDFFDNLPDAELDLDKKTNGEEQSIEITVKDKDDEITIKGKTSFKITDSKELLISIQFTYTEIDDGKEEDKFDISASFNLDLDSLSPKEIIDLIVQGKINIKDLGDINVKIDGKEVWVEAFLDEID
ncbi:MAG: hypothetical protein MSA93_06145, partial [Spirochaetales bacterium]|nr:hypothetical protein [Spirochaetales bacterium]